MGAKKSDFFDSRDKYLSFVNSTNEKSRIAFQLAKYLKNSKITKDAFRILMLGQEMAQSSAHCYRLFMTNFLKIQL